MRRLPAILVIAWSAIHFAVSGIRQPLANFYGDFLAAFPSWQFAATLGRLDLYSRLAYIWGPPPLWNYGPLLHFVTLPLLALPSLRSAYVALLMVDYLILAATIVVAIGILDDWKPTLPTAIIVIAVFCNFNPLYEGLTQRVIELFELLLIFAAFAWLQRGRDTAAGAAIGAAAMLKFLPLIFLPWLVLKRRWRALGGALAVIVPTGIATQFVLGWQNSRIVQQLAGGGLIDGVTDQSLAGMLRRLSLGGASHAAIVIVLAALSLLMLRLRSFEGAEDLEWSLLTVAMVLLPPHNENYYLLFLTFPFLLAARRRISPLLVLSFLLVAAPVPFSMFGPNAFAHYLAAGIPFLGTALLGGILTWELGMSCAVSTAEQQCPWKKPSPIWPLS
jgi:hypothetical protein